MNYKVFEELKEIDLQILDSLNRDKEEILLIEKRQEIINKIISIDLFEEKINEYYNYCEFKRINEQIRSIMIEKINKVKEELKRAGSSRKAITGYNNASTINRNFYSTII